MRVFRPLYSVAYCRRHDGISLENDDGSWSPCGLIARQSGDGACDLATVVYDAGPLILGPPADMPDGVALTVAASGVVCGEYGENSWDDVEVAP